MSHAQAMRLRPRRGAARDPIPDMWLCGCMSSLRREHPQATELELLRAAVDWWNEQGRLRREREESG